MGQISCTHFWSSSPFLCFSKRWTRRSQFDGPVKFCPTLLNPKELKKNLTWHGSLGHLVPGHPPRPEGVLQVLAGGRRRQRRGCARQQGQGHPQHLHPEILTPDFAVFTQSFASNSFPGALPPHKVSLKPPHHRGNCRPPVLLPRLVGNWARFRVNIPTTDGDDTGTGIFCACVATTRWRSGGRLGGWPGPQGTCNLINSPLSWYRSFWHPALVTWVWISPSFLIDILKLEIMGSKSFWHVSGIDHGTETDLWLCWLFYRVVEQFNLFPQ